MDDKQAEMEAWVNHFQSMAQGIDSNEQKNFYILKKKPKPSLSTSKDTPSFVSPAEAVVDRAVEEIKRQKREEEDPPANKKTKRKRIEIISDSAI